MTSPFLIALSNEVNDILVTGREGQVLRKDRLNVLSGDHITVTLVEQSIALLGLFILSRLRFDTLVPVVGHDVFTKLQVHVSALLKINIALFKFFLNVTRAHLVEAEILKNVAEQVLRDERFIILTVVIKALFKIRGHLGRNIADNSLIRRLGEVPCNSSLSSCFHCFNFRK